MSNRTYSAYFDIDENYFPCIDDAAIRAGALWENTYPHETFITLLNAMERALARQNGNKTLWVEGAYGTGKSQCVYALKKILEVDEAELRSYWEQYEILKQKHDLLEKIIGHRRSGILTAYRYASGSIRSSRDLFFAVQQTLKEALDSRKLYGGEATLKESVSAWIAEPSHKRFFDDLLKKPEWNALFPQSTADEVLAALKSPGGEIKTLMDNIFQLADREGITALNIDADRLVSWITDIIDRNNIKVVFIWDEFSDYFKNNRNSLSDFQQLIALVQSMPFYFIVVTHDSKTIYFSEGDKDNKNKVSDRVESIQISLPDNIAFELIGHALKVKEAARTDWVKLADNLNSRVDEVRPRVMEAARIKDPQVMRKIMPLHPMAALLLKNIASAFKSNQRSMFDFIKTTGGDDTRAFQWFIAEHGPFDDHHPLLTVDMLWNFFYEKGKDNLSPDIRSILDFFPQQRDLREDEQRVLKVILIMQAIDKRLGGAIDLFKATDRHLSYVFEGISDMEGSKSGHIAKDLKDKDRVVIEQIGSGRYRYVAPLTGPPLPKPPPVETLKLVNEGELATALALPRSLCLRVSEDMETGRIVPVAVSNFTKTINTLGEKSTGWNFQVVLVFAKDDSEEITLRNSIKKAIAQERYKNITFIDVLSTHLGPESEDEYQGHVSRAMAYQGNNNTASREYADKAKAVLADWKNRIYNGPCIVYDHSNQDGEKVANAAGVAAVLQVIVKRRFPLVFDFARGLTEAQLKPSQLKVSAKAGIVQKTGGVVKDIEKHVLPLVWNQPDYWTNSNLAAEPIVKIKLDLDHRIQEAFQKEGQIAVAEVYAALEQEYGFAPCNLSAFLAGFLLKEYGGDPYRASDASGAHEPMTPDRLADMLAACINKKEKRPTAIVRMTPDEMAFYELTETVWGVPAGSCASADQAARAIEGKMRNLRLPLWCLESVDATGCCGIVRKYLDLVQSEGPAAHKKAVDLGRIAAAKPGLGEDLRELVTAENCQKGMLAFLQDFENGQLPRLAGEIGATGSMLKDIGDLFDVKHSCLWNRETGENEIRKLLTDYGIARESNAILNTSAQSFAAACANWRDRLRFFGVSGETLKAKRPDLGKACGLLLKVYGQDELLPEQRQSLHEELVARGPALKDALDNEQALFAAVYAPYLEDLSADDIATVKSNAPNGLFACSPTDCNARVKAAAEEYRKSRLKARLARLWQDRTGTKNPKEWSRLHRTPALCCARPAEYEKARAVFDILNKNWGADADIEAGLAYLENTALFAELADEKRRDAAFRRGILGAYAALLPVELVREKLEKLAVDAYDWPGNPQVLARVRELAEAEYNAGGSDKALRKIDAMDDALLKQYLKKLVRDNMRVGIEILNDDGGTGGERRDA